MVTKKAVRAFRILRMNFFYGDTEPLARLYRRIAIIFRSVRKSGRSRRIVSTKISNPKNGESQTVSSQLGLSGNVILYHKGKSGLCALIRMVVLSMDMLKDQSVVIEIDFNNYPVSFSKAGKWMNEYNAWNYFFCQPRRAIDHELIGSSSKMLEIRQISQLHPFKAKSFDFLDDQLKIERLRTAFQENFSFSDLFNEYIQHLEEALEFDSSRTLGVFFRGMRHEENPGHPRSFYPKEIANEINKTELIHGISHLLIGTHLTSAKLDVLLNLNEKLSLLPDFRFKNRGKIANHLQKKLHLEEGKPLHQLDYLAEVFLLGRCRQYIGEVGNTTSVIAMNSNPGQNFKTISKGFFA